MKRGQAIAAVLVATLLTACGGGGGGGSAPPPPQGPTVALASAISAFMQASHNYTLSTTIGADVYSIQMSFTPGAQATFESHVVATMNESAVIQKNGVTAATATGTEYFDVSPFKAWGYVGSDGSYELMSGQQLIPSSATVGQSGALDFTTTYTDNTKTTVTATSVRSWSVSPDTATTAWGCINETVTPTGGGQYTVAQCYKVDAPGNVSAVKATYFLNGQSLTFQ